ncbi:MAG TPA: AAA family ATPase [Trichormus sp. M33_DOE_039]|nr:AAA family ATPase [Trichormus sp. M33_DOE_039]
MPNFPQYDGKIPQCLSPFNPIHYCLLAYWVYFRPKALICYLYQAAPEIYQYRDFRQIFRLWRITAYRHLYGMTLLVIILFCVLVISLVIPQEVLAHKNKVNGLVVIPHSQIAVSASSDGTVRLWDFNYKPSPSILPSNIAASLNSNADNLDNTRWREQLIWHSGAKGVSAIALSYNPQKRYVVTGLANNTSFDSYLWEIIPYLEKTFQVRIHHRHLSHKIQSVETGTLKVWDWETGKFLHTLAGHTEAVNAVVIAPDNSTAISASNDKTLKVWDINTGKELRTLVGHQSGVNAVVIASDNSTAISASDDKTLKVWDINTGKELRTLVGHQSGVNAVVIAPDNSTAISASDDRNIKVWDINTGKELRTIRGNNEAVKLMGLTSDGKKLIYFTATSTAPQFLDWAQGVKLHRVNELLHHLHLANLEYLLIVIMVISGLLTIPLILATSVATFGNIGAVIGGILGMIILPYVSPLWYLLSPLYGVVPSSLFVLVKLGFYTRLLPLVMAGGVASRKAFGVVGSVIFFTSTFATFLGVTADVMPISTTHPDLLTRILVSLGGSVVIAIAYGIVSGIISILSSSRLIFHPIYLPLALSSRFGKGKHPVEWDELIVLPLPGTKGIITQRLQQNEVKGLHLLAEVASNPFQRAVAQQALHTYLHQQVAPLRFIYHLLTNPDWQTYIYPPVSKQDWQQFPTTGQVLLGELGGQWVDCSSDWFNHQAERCIWQLTQCLRNHHQTPLTHFAAMLYQLLAEVENFNLSAHHQAYTDIADYNDGAEITQSFAALAKFLAYTQISELPQAVSEVSALTAINTAIRPCVLTALAELGKVGAEVATYQTATSQVNKLAALARASKNLDDLDKFLIAVATPEKSLLRRIISQWRPLLTEASGKFGFLEITQPVANPYVIGNPVTGKIFVGREDIMRRLEELWMVAGQCPSVILYGHRRMGKSSILRNLHLRLGTNTAIVDFNMQRVGMVANTGELIYNLALSLYDVLPSEQQLQLGEPQEERFFKHNPYTAFDRFLKQINQVRGEKRFIITIDEFELIEQLIAENYLESRFLDFLRGLIQTYPWFIIAFAGLHTLQEMTQNYWNPLFGSVTAIPISFISSKAAERLIVQPSDEFNLDYEQAAVDMIIQLTNGQPYLLQLIGHTLITYFNRQTFEEGVKRERKFTSLDVETVINTPEFYRDGNAYFNGVWVQVNKSKPAGQTVILQILSHQSLSSNEIVNSTGLSFQQVQAALLTLQRHDVIKCIGEKYIYTVELMRRWVIDCRQSNLSS